MKTGHREYSIGLLWAEQHRINFSPVYQREAGVWSVEKQQLLIDSIMNNFDIPKFYLHEFDPKEPIIYAIIDGKQRIQAILDFMNDKFPLRDDFSYTGYQTFPGQGPAINQKFSDLGSDWKEWFRAQTLPITLIGTDDMGEIEEMFSRLNSGEKLNSAETRNAFGGQMNDLIRKVAGNDFFTKKVTFKSTRYAFYEVACRFLFIEDRRVNKVIVPDIKKTSLDKFVKDNKTMKPDEAKKLLSSVEKQLRTLCKVFPDHSSELLKQTYPQVYFIFIRELKSKYTSTTLDSHLLAFFPRFEKYRIEESMKLEEDRADWDQLGLYALQAQQGTNNASGMGIRIDILTAFFLRWYPSVEILDKTREFNQTERLALYLLADKKCQECELPIPSLSEMHADHVKPHSLGGKTHFSNGRALCVPCNLAKSAKFPPP